MVFDLEQRVQKAKDNVESVNKIMTAWVLPIFERKENKKVRSKLILWFKQKSDNGGGGGGFTRPIPWDGGADQLHGVPVIGRLPTDGTSRNHFCQWQMTKLCSEIGNASYWQNTLMSDNMQPKYRVFCGILL